MRKHLSGKKGSKYKAFIYEKIIEYFNVNAFEFRELAKDLKELKLVHLKYGHRMSQMIPVYQRPETRGKCNVQNDVVEYECAIDYSVDYAKIFNSRFLFKYVHV